MTPPASGFPFLALTVLVELFPILGGQRYGRFPELGPSGMSAPRLSGVCGRDIERAAAPLLGPSDIKVGTVAAGRIAMTGAVGIPAAPGGFRQAPLDHALGGAEEFAEELLPTHIIILR